MAKADYDLGLKADYFISMARGEVGVERDRFIGIRDGRIRVLREFKAGDEKTCVEFKDLQGKAVLPGLINAHTHLPMTLLRGIEDDVALHHWLFDRIFPLEAKFMNGENVELGTRLAALECARFGVTTVADMYFHTDSIIRAWDQSGLRGMLSQGFIDFPTPEDGVVPDGEKHFKDLHRKYRDHPLIRLGIAAHAPYSCSDETLKKAVRVTTETDSVLQIHLQETQKEVEDSIREWGVRPTQRLKNLGFLKPRTLLHHGVHLDAEDIRHIVGTGASVVHNPDSNMKLGSGVAPLRALIDSGVNVALGTDGAASANSLCLLSAMNVGAKLQKVHAGRTDIIQAKEMLFMATLGGARALGWEDEIGSLEEGKAADLIAIDLEQPHLQPVNDVISHLVYSARGQDVDLTVVAGKILMDDKRLKLPWSLQSLRPQLEVIRSAVRKAIEELKIKKP